jgi:hypothetical protein
MTIYFIRNFKRDWYFVWAERFICFFIPWGGILMRRGR